MTTNALYSIAEEKGYQVYGVPLSERLCAAAMAGMELGGAELSCLVR